MQTTRHAGLAKRARLYQAHMDINQLQRGQFYTRLRPSFVIFICTFDPFDEGRYLYSFRNVCRETGAELDDEAYKLFFNTAGTRDSAVYERPEELSGRKGRPSADPLD